MNNFFSLGFCYSELVWIYLSRISPCQITIDSSSKQIMFFLLLRTVCHIFSEYNWLFFAIIVDNIGLHLISEISLTSGKRVNNCSQAFICSFCVCVCLILTFTLTLSSPPYPILTLFVPLSVCLQAPVFLDKAIIYWSDFA